jgi:hypothetical protein
MHSTHSGVHDMAQHPNQLPSTMTTSGGGVTTDLLSALPRIPTAGKIRAGIKVLTRKAAEHKEARALYAEGVQKGQTFDDIERSIAKALPSLKSSPLVPRNVPWFTVRRQDFAHPALAQQIVERFSEDRGEGPQVYRFPVVFPADHWPTVMPHELATWAASEKRFWSEYEEGQRMCKCKAPVPLQHSGKRVIRIFGGRKAVLREQNRGRCEPEICPEYQARQCNLTGRFIFFIPGIQTLSAFELPTRSFYAMNSAMQMFEAVRSLRGGRLAGFIDNRKRTPFYFTKRLMQVSHMDESGQLVRMPQWIIDLEAPVDVSELLAQRDDVSAIQQADVAAEVLQGPSPIAAVPSAEPAPSIQDGAVDRLKVLAQAQAMGLAEGQFEAYAAQRWGPGWALNQKGCQRVWDDLQRHRHDPQGYCGKVRARLALVGDSQ